MAVEALAGAGCAPVIVVLGASAGRAAAVLSAEAPVQARIVVAPDWQDGMGASLRSGLEAAARCAPADVPAAVLVTLVDLPDVGEAVARRVVERWRWSGTRTGVLARATYLGRPGHPVLIGRDHWRPLIATLGGDAGAASYLERHVVLEVPCEDLATGRDADFAADTW